MPTPTRSSSYPPEVRAAIIRAIELGTLKIPCPNPAALRLQFYGYIGALRKEKADPELPEACTFSLQKTPFPALVIQTREKTPVAESIRAALASPIEAPPSEEDFDALLARITSNPVKSP